MTGRDIKARRERIPASGTEVARLAGVGYRALHDWEEGTRQPWPRTKRRVARALAVLEREQGIRSPGPGRPPSDEAEALVKALQKTASQFAGGA